MLKLIFLSLTITLAAACSSGGGGYDGNDTDDNPENLIEPITRSIGLVERTAPTAVVNLRRTFVSFPLVTL